LSLPWHTGGRVSFTTRRGGSIDHDPNGEVTVTVKLNAVHTKRAAMKQRAGKLLYDAGNVVRGLLMGAADVIPGVSGGTIALILGIYERLVSAISHFDASLIGLVRRQQWLAAARHVDLRFLVGLGCGIGAGIVSLGGLMNELLAGANSRPLILAAFFGMIVASAVIVARKIDLDGPAQLLPSGLLILLGAVFAWWLTTMDKSTVEPSLAYLFFCGMIGICAMILPGISGAYLLMILGAYAHMTHILKGLPKGEISAQSLTEVAVFATGCGLGLLCFSKVLRWLLAHRHWQTLSVLCGFMIGALREIWPFQKDLTPAETELKHKEFANLFPEINGTFFTVLVIVLAAMAAVFALDFVGRRTKAAVDSREMPDSGE
jgi:putative membrane protein